MELPDYWLKRPDMSLDDETRAIFDDLLSQVKSAGSNPLIHYSLTPPKWQFLCYLADQHGIAMHGSGKLDIQVFEPRQPIDLTAFGSQKAVFAAGDGIWAMFFAIVDRQNYPMWINNACIRLVDPAGQASQPYYVFSVSQTVLPQRPWRSGMVYLLPPEGFVTQASIPFGAYEVRIPQLASPEPVIPIARLEIKPEDFPFLDDIRGHDDTRIAEYGQAMQSGAPWPS